MKKIICSFVFFLTFTFPAGAVFLDSLVFDITPDKSFTSRAVLNDTTRNNLYQLTVFKIDKPGRGGENRITGGDKEVLYSPLRFTVQPGEKDYFKLFYRGPSDDQERYYRVIFRESPVLLFPLKQEKQHMYAIPVIALSTLLIVRPRNVKLDFTFDEENGTIRNTGNTFFRVIIQKGCHGDDESSLQFAYSDPNRSLIPM
ncbi:molecular chaperone [Erwinia psidii]|uniref:molecular chaperone n=1 Tax=Erwinia psidii TaxID=69224 RepID=UPI00226BB04F|nr:molecular chaperone [Erwinia psidii]MCX8963865.1 molecular chaperone [Erwinia psidii]